LGNAAPVATIEGQHVYQGNNPSGPPIATALGGGKMDAAAAAAYFLLL
jgi:hypothetical protein